MALLRLYPLCYTARMARKLRIAASVFFALLTVALCVLWVRSYWWREMAMRLTSNNVLTTLGSDHGTVYISHGLTDPLRSISLQIMERDKWETSRMESSPGYLGFRLWSHPDYLRIHIPHWFAILTFGAIAVATLPQTHWSFSLRTLLIATTLVAVVLGLGVWLAS